jgi:hypothetical protein
MIALAALLVLLTLSGCADLQLKNNDDGLTKTGKVIARTLLAVPTIGVSEAVTYGESMKARCIAEHGPDFEWYGRMGCQHPSQFQVVPMIPLMLNLPSAPSPRYTPPPLTPVPMNRCTSQIIGNQVQTSCF